MRTQTDTDRHRYRKTETKTHTKLPVKFDADQQSDPINVKKEVFNKTQCQLCKRLAEPVFPGMVCKRVLPMDVIGGIQKPFFCVFGLYGMVTIE